MSWIKTLDKILLDPEHDYWKIIRLICDALEAAGIDVPGYKDPPEPSKKEEKP